MRYDPRKDFEPITQASLYPNAIVVNNDVPAKNLTELIALLKKGVVQYSYGSDGNGTASHLGMELLKNQGQFASTHIPYRGSAPDYPTVAEQGFPGFAAPPWSGFFAPKGTHAQGVG